jgi:hypothetical protein
MAAKSLFDHIKGVTIRKTKWEDLSEEDTKSWSNYMIARFFSMEPEFVEAINEFQTYSNGILSSKDYYKLLHDVLPKKSFFLKYIKGKNKIDIEPEMVSVFCNHYELGRNEVYGYIKYLAKENPDELIGILKQYGTPEADIKKFEKQLKTVK